MAKDSVQDTAAPTSGMTADQIIALVKALKDDDEDALRRKAEIDADAMARATGQQAVKPSPEISVYSYPEGDLKRPRPPFKAKMLWVGYPLRLDTTTVEELELLNRMEPGEYRCQKVDGSPLTLNVIAKRNVVTGAVEQLESWFPCKGKDKDNLFSMATMLRQALKEDPMAAQLDEIARLRAELAAAQSQAAIQ